MRYLIGLILFLSTLTAQVTDKNFKDKIGSGFAVVIFTSNYQEKDLDGSILKGVKGHEDAQIFTVKSADLRKVIKKLRIRNYPSIADLISLAEQSTSPSISAFQTSFLEPSKNKATDG